LHARSTPNDKLLSRTANQGGESSSQADVAARDMRMDESVADDHDADHATIREWPNTLQADHRQHAPPLEGEADLQGIHRRAAKVELIVNRAHRKRVGKHRQRTSSGGAGARARRAELRASSSGLPSYEEAVRKGLIG
jgi:hypothetical protein